jgi:hypothetical protein
VSHSKSALDSFDIGDDPTQVPCFAPLLQGAANVPGTIHSELERFRQSSIKVVCPFDRTIEDTHKLDRQLLCLDSIEVRIETQRAGQVTTLTQYTLQVEVASSGQVPLNPRRQIRSTQAARAVSSHSS